MDWTSPAFARASEGKFYYTDSLRFWQTIAEGQISEEEKAWMQLVAKRVLSANMAEGARRAESMLKAVGLSGRDKHAELREVVQTMRDFDATPAEMLKTVRDRGLADHIDGDDALREIIRRELTKE